MTMKLLEDESVILSPEEDPVFREDFEGGKRRLSVHLSTGRDYDGTPPEDADDDVVAVVNTRPDPDVVIYEQPGGEHTVALAAGPLVYVAFEVSHDNLPGFITRMVVDIEVAYEGIESADFESASPPARYLGLRKDIERVLEVLTP